MLPTVLPPVIVFTLLQDIFKIYLLKREELWCGGNSPHLNTTF